MKNVGVIVFTILVAFAATSYGISQTWGNIGPKDKIIFSQRVFNITSYHGLTRTVQFPENRRKNKLKITAVQAVDQSPDQTNSQPTVFSGGPGFKFLTMNFKNVGRANLDYQLTIYGKK